MTELLDLRITQGTDYRLRFVIRDEAGNEIDCTDWEAKSAIRDSPVSEGGKLVATFLASFQSSSNGILSVLQLDLPKAESRKLCKRLLYWDLDLIDAEGLTKTPRSGSVHVLLEYTV